MEINSFFFFYHTYNNQEMYVTFQDEKLTQKKVAREGGTR